MLHHHTSSCVIRRVYKPPKRIYALNTWSKGINLWDKNSRACKPRGGPWVWWSGHQKPVMRSVIIKRATFTNKAYLCHFENVDFRSSGGETVKVRTTGSGLHKWRKRIGHQDLLKVFVYKTLVQHYCTILCGTKNRTIMPQFWTCAYNKCMIWHVHMLYTCTRH